MITEPLSGMVDKLDNHAVVQLQKIVDLNDTKQEIDKRIGAAENEKAMPIATARNIKAFMDPTKILVIKDVEPNRIPDGETEIDDNEE